MFSFIISINIPMFALEWTRLGMLTHFTVVRKLDDTFFLMGFKKEATDKNSKVGSNIISMESREGALLNRLMIELHKLDSDILVGHNISGFDLVFFSIESRLAKFLTACGKK
ncbi:hypothetical protein L2E82_16610 [Cichorium intybus]|uniref:Uncharacterized protein n=1 Tax=Cichorium intybus TaxID=13427 RepID=A0ACB9F6L8_CICIN|nr:hypothetical protein L2E82_16610 [Cichorium intybus]